MPFPQVIDIRDMEEVVKRAEEWTLEELNSEQETLKLRFVSPHELVIDNNYQVDEWVEDIPDKISFWTWIEMKKLAQYWPHRPCPFYFWGMK